MSYSGLTRKDFFSRVRHIPGGRIHVATGNGNWQSTGTTGTLAHASEWRGIKSLMAFLYIYHRLEDIESVRYYFSTRRLEGGDALINSGPPLEDSIYHLDRTILAGADDHLNHFSDFLILPIDLTNFGSGDDLGYAFGVELLSDNNAAGSLAAISFVLLGGGLFQEPNNITVL